MVSAERVMAYGKLQSEGALESHSDHPPTNWPTKGHIEITDLSYKYSTIGPLVLQGINCSIAPGEKVYCGTRPSKIGTMTLQKTLAPKCPLLLYNGIINVTLYTL